MHPRKNVITKALGAEENIIPDCFEQRLGSGNYLLFCTDGLTNYVEPSEILKIIKKNDAETISEILVDLANSNGGGDNITVVLVAV